MFKLPMYKNHELLVKNSMAIVYFALEDHSKAIYWMNQVVNQDSTSIREDTRAIAMLFNIIIHYEYGNEDLLEYLLKSAYSFLNRKNKAFKLEKLMLDFVKNKLSKPGSKAKLLDAFKYLRSELLKLKDDPYENKPFEQFDFIAWLDSKIKRRSFREVVRDNMKHTN